MTEKQKEFFKLIGIDPETLNTEEADPSAILGEYTGRVKASALSDPEVIKSIEAAHYAKVVGGLNAEIKRIAGLSEADVKGKSPKEAMAIAVAKIKEEGGKGQEELLAKLQAAAAVAEENEALKLQLAELPQKWEADMKHRNAENAQLMNAYQKIAGQTPLSFEEFALLAKSTVLSGEVYFDAAGVMRKKNAAGTGPETDTAYKPLDMGAKLVEYALTKIPKQNAPAATPPPAQANGKKVFGSDSLPKDFKNPFIK